MSLPRRTTNTIHDDNVDRLAYALLAIAKAVTRLAIAVAKRK